MWCSKCGEPNERTTQRYCLACHAAYMREWRKDHPIKGAAKQRDGARHYAGTYKRRGLLTPQPCEVCGSTDHLEMHHDDYDFPLVVRWHCRSHHIDLHRKLQETSA